MLVQQISIFIENKSGRLADVVQCLAEEGIDTRALSLADTTNFGVLRLIVDKPEKAMNILKEKNFAASTTEVISVMVPDVPGGLAEVLAIFSEKNVDIEYMYAFIGKESEKAMVILKIDNPHEGIKKLEDTKIQLLSADKVYSM